MKNFQITVDGNEEVKNFGEILWKIMLAELILKRFLSDLMDH